MFGTSLTTTSISGLYADSRRAEERVLNQLDLGGRTKRYVAVWMVELALGVGFEPVAVNSGSLDTTRVDMWHRLHI
jgi:hypothetical protein